MYLLIMCQILQFSKCLPFFSERTMSGEEKYKKEGIPLPGLHRKFAGKSKKSVLKKVRYSPEFPRGYYEVKSIMSFFPEKCLTSNFPICKLICNL